MRSWSLQIIAKVFATAFAVLWLMSLPVSWAVEPDEILADAELEARARALSSEIRCLVCQNQSIDDSDAELARELRILIRERLTGGDSDDEVKDYLVSRYGDFVLFNPPLRASTFAIWFGPFIFLAFGLLIAFFYLRAQRPVASQASLGLSAEERQRLDEVLNLAENSDGDSQASTEQVSEDSVQKGSGE